MTIQDFGYWFAGISRRDGKSLLPSTGLKVNKVEEAPEKMKPMPADSRQVEFWDRAVDKKSFRHPVNFQLLERLVCRDRKVVELGCGWGRVLSELAAAGYRDLAGFDPSPKMIERGRSEFPALDLRLWPPGGVPLESGSAEAVLLFAVLTCIPSDVGQRELIAEAARLLRPDGVLYISDYFIQNDERNRRRYREWEPVHGRYGVFEIEGGAVLRHMERSWFFSLVGEFVQEGFEEFQLLAMNGNPARAFQYLGRKTAGKV